MAGRTGIRDEIRATARAAGVLARGPSAPAAGRPGGRARAGLRAALLRALRPYSAHQYQLDSELLAALGEQEAALAAAQEAPERHEERHERLELYVGDLTRAVEGLSRQAQTSQQSAPASHQP